MTLTQLEYVIAVSKHCHFGKAAKSCFVTQPTLSMQLQKLEEELEVVIFDRSKSPIRPTDEGKAIIEQAKAVLFEQKKILSIIADTKEAIAGDFKLAVIPTLSPFIIPLFIQPFVEKHPSVNLQIIEITTEEILEALKRDEIDAALLATPLYEPKLTERVLYYEPFYLFSSAKHPIAKKKKIRQDDLNLDEIWLLNKGNCFRNQVLNICSESSSRENPINFDSGSFETLKNMVLKGFGYTIIPHMALKYLSSSHKKLVRPFYAPIPTREISLIHSKNCLKERIIDAVEEEILGAIPDDLRNIKAKDRQTIEFEV